MIQFLHDPNMQIVEYLLGAAFVSFLGLSLLAARILREKKRDINRPDVFKKEMYAEDDIEEIVVESALPVPLVHEKSMPVTPHRAIIATFLVMIVIAGSWLGIKNLRILRDWDAGEQFQSHHDFSGAEDIYRASVQIDPQVRKSHRLLAEMLLKLKENNQAISELQKAANGDRTDPEIHVLLGDALQSAERPAEAMPQYQQAVAISPRLANAYVRMGSCLVKLNRTDDAIKQFQYAATLDPKDAAAQTNLASVLLMRGDADGAIMHLKRSIELAPSDPGVHNTLGTTYGRMKLYPQAVAEFRAELAINPQFNIGYFNLGSALMKMGDNRAAEDAFASYLKNTFSLSPTAQGPDAKQGVQAAFDALQRLQKEHPELNPGAQVVPHGKHISHVGGNR